MATRATDPYIEMLNKYDDLQRKTIQPTEEELQQMEELWSECESERFRLEDLELGEDQPQNPEVGR